MKYKINYKNVIKLLSSTLFIMLFILIIMQIMIRPELVSTVLKKQLQADLQNENEIAIQYYENVYTNHGIYLFGENNK